MKIKKDNHMECDKSCLKKNSLQLLFIGTGAADHDWDHIGKPGVRGSSSALLDGRVLIDAGITVWENIRRFEVDPDEISDILITHTHNDHFLPEVIANILAARKSALPLDIYVSPEGCRTLETVLCGGGYNLHPLKAGDNINVNGWNVIVLPSNHIISDKNLQEETFWFLFETPAGNFMYALDGAWITTRAAALIYPRKLDWIVWDCTMEKAGDMRSFEHTDLTMLDMMINGLRARNSVDDSTLHICSHMAKTLWPEDMADSENICRSHGFVMAYDGMKIQLERKEK